MKNPKEYAKNVRLWAAISGVALIASPALAGTNSADGTTEVTISISGSTALKNFVTGTGITQVTPGVTFTLNLGNGNVQIPAAGDTNWYSGGSFQLAPKVFDPTQNTTVGLTQSVNALRVEYHESGSVEGIYELANDQIGPVPYVQTYIDRNPNGGNAVWINGNQIGGVGAPGGASLTPPNNDPNNNYLGPFYGINTLGQVQTYGPGIEATFNLAGVNTSNVVGSSNGYTQAGQNAVQIAVADVVPVQAFTNLNSSDPAASEPWFSTPQNYGYGLGNTKLPSGGLNVAGGQVNLQTSSVLNMPASAINPRTGGTFGVGPWNAGALANLNSQTTAVAATLYMANPGTGLDHLDQTDAQWLETTGRLANGAMFNMTTRDVNSGTHNVAALDVGLDPSFAVGVNDNGNGNAPSGATTQIDIGAGLRFSEKTSGGAQLRPTVQNNRMAVGTLGDSDANGVWNTGDAYGLRALEYADDTAQYSNTNTGNTVSYVLVSANNILNGAYVIYQNEQLVTLKAPEAGDAAFSQMTTQQWAQVITGTAVLAPTNGFSGVVTAQGDDSNSTAMQLINNIQAGLVLQNFSTLATSGYSYLNKGYILPQLMEVEKPEDGLDLSSPNPIQNAALTTAFLASAYTSYTTASNPDSIDSSSGDVYGGKGTNVSSFNGTIPITNSDNGDGGNYLFGNFNQNGIRDFDSVVVTAEEALGVLEASGLGTSAFGGASNSSVVPTGTFMLANSDGVTNAYTLPSALADMTNSVGGTGATKGDLIVMGDYDGRGVFDGLSLYELAIGASIADGTATPQTNVFGNGGSDHLALQALGTASYQVVNADGSTTTVTQETFGDAVRRGSLFKNAALDYLNNFATPQMKQEARSVLEIFGTNVPSGATDLGADASNVGYEDYTFDSAGANAYNKNDVNRDGTVDFNDAVLVDKFKGQDYTNMGDQIDATQQAPVTGTIEPISLTVVNQTDSSTVIGAADLSIINAGLAQTNNANWYGYNLQQTGPGAIIWGRTAGAVTVYTGASFEISGGSVQVGGTVDPFSDNTGGATSGNHVAVALDHGATLAFTQSSLKSTVSALTVDTASGSVVDIGTNTLAIDYAGQSDPISSIVSYLTSGYHNGAWNGPGINSSVASAQPGLYSVGYLDSSDNGGVPNQVLVKFTIAGDANLDGTVNFADLLVVAQNFNKSGEDWAGGNFIYAANGLVNFADLLLVAQHFNDSLAGGGSPLALTGDSLAHFSATDTGVPEPATTTLMMVGAAGLLARRRRRQRA